MKPLVLCMPTLSINHCLDSIYGFLEKDVLFVYDVLYMVG